MQYTIIGGIKYKTNAAKKLNMPMLEPNAVDIYISDAAPILEEGTRVVTGQAIAKSENGYTVHSSLDGEITKVSREFITVFGKYNADVKPLEEYCHSFDSESRQEMISYMLSAGLPDSVEIALRQEMCNTRYIIINCMSEPSPENAKKIINGGKLILLALGIRTAVITISRKNKKLARAIEKLTYDREMFLIAMLPKRHPLEIHEAVATALYPYTPFSDVFVLSPLSCIAAYDAFAESKPYVGHTLKLRYKKYYGEIFCPTGTSFGQLKSFFSENSPERSEKWETCIGISGIGLPCSDNKIIGSDLGAVTFRKVLPSNAKISSQCISCGKCREVCPVELSPYVIVSGAAISGIHKCLSCGCCSHVCPVGIGLGESINKHLGGADDEE